MSGLQPTKPEEMNRAPQNADMKTWLVYLVKELGVSTALIAFICYLLAVQLPSMQSDFRMQTDKMIEAVHNNTTTMGEVISEIRDLRNERERDLKWWNQWNQKPNNK